MKEAYLAIDIGTSSIKAIERNEQGEIVNWGILERRSQPFHTSIAPLSVADVTSHLLMLLHDMRPTADMVVASIPAFLAHTEISETPDASSVPAPAGAFESDVVTLPDGKFLIVAIPKDVIDKYKEIMNGVHLKLINLELESAAVARTLASQNRRILVVDVGARSTTFTVAQSGKPIFISQTDFATASRNNSKDVIMKEAKEIAKEKSIQYAVSSGGLRGWMDVVKGLSP